MGELWKVGNAVYTLVLQGLVGCHAHTIYIAPNSHAPDQTHHSLLQVTALHLCAFFVIAHCSPMCSSKNHIYEQADQS